VTVDVIFDCVTESAGKHYSLLCANLFVAAETAITKALFTLPLEHHCSSSSQHYGGITSMATMPVKLLHFLRGPAV
jgi:hypothetical protein